MRRLALGASNRVLIAGFNEISQMADRIMVPQSIVDRANLLFKQVGDTGYIIKGRNGAKAAACLYIACRQEGVPRTFKEICAVTKTNKKEIGRTFKHIINGIAAPMDLIKSDDFMSRFCSNLGLSRQIQRAAFHIAQKAFDLCIVIGRSPISVAAAAIYMASQASDDRRSQREIGSIAGVADVTIRQSYRLMRPHAEKLFPENFTFVKPINMLPDP